MDYAARAKRQQRANNRPEDSVEPPDLFEDDSDDTSNYMDDVVSKKRQQRMNQRREESVEPPNLFGMQSEEDEVKLEDKTDSKYDEDKLEVVEVEQFDGSCTKPSELSEHVKYCF